MRRPRVGIDAGGFEDGGCGKRGVHECRSSLAVDAQADARTGDCQIGARASLGNRDRWRAIGSKQERCTTKTRRAQRDRDLPRRKRTRPRNGVRMTAAPSKDHLVSFVSLWCIFLQLTDCPERAGLAMGRRHSPTTLATRHDPRMHPPSRETRRALRGLAVGDRPRSAWQRLWMGGAGGFL